MTGRLVSILIGRPTYIGGRLRTYARSNTRARGFLACQETLLWVFFLLLFSTHTPPPPLIPKARAEVKPPPQVRSNTTTLALTLLVVQAHDQKSIRGLPWLPSFYFYPSVDNLKYKLLLLHLDALPSSRYCSLPALFLVNKSVCSVDTIS